ncbi:VOC family protein [Cupriavidus sp. WS]|uniref:VOC family protein n=1 Tax=Cupriavidus sp. WS TaxID=1312922 RepID=UPI00037ADBDD|nr:VOC family protein [Cupriavidus sp. WS]
MQLLIQLDVDDLARGIGFYRRGLGLSLARTLSGGAVAEMRGGGAPIYLRAGRAAMPGMRRPRRTPARLDFVVADLEAAIERALAAGAELEDWPQDLPEGRCAMLCDPFGHGLCFVEWHGHDHASHHAPAAGRPPRRAPARGGALPG